MSPFVAEFAKKLVEKWFSLLVLPGMLLLGTTSVACALGQRTWADAGRVVAQADGIAVASGTRPASEVVLLLLGVLVAAAGLGVVATGLGSFVGRLWSGSWPAWTAPSVRRLVSRRRARFERRQTAYDARQRELAETPAADLKPGSPERMELDELARRRDAVAPVMPTQPTWMGDRMAAVQNRVLAQYDLDVVVAWPRLWLIMPEDRRAELRAAASTVDAAAMLAGWGVLYVVVGVAWWPSAVAGVIICLTGRYRARGSVDAYAGLVESAVDLNLVALGEHLGLTAGDGGVKALGGAIDSRLHKRS